MLKKKEPLFLHFRKKSKTTKLIIFTRYANKTTKLHLLFFFLNSSSKSQKDFIKTFYCGEKSKTKMKNNCGKHHKNTPYKKDIVKMFIFSFLLY